MNTISNTFKDDIRKEEDSKSEVILAAREVEIVAEAEHFRISGVPVCLQALSLNTRGKIRHPLSKNENRYSKAIMGRRRRSIFRNVRWTSMLAN